MLTTTTAQCFDLLYRAQPMQWTGFQQSANAQPVYNRCLLKGSFQLAASEKKISFYLPISVIIFFKNYNFGTFLIALRWLFNAIGQVFLCYWVSFYVIGNFNCSECRNYKTILAKFWLKHTGGHTARPSFWEICWHFTFQKKLIWPSSLLLSLLF